MQFVLTMKWFESRLRFKNLKSDISLNSFLPTEVGDIWVPELIFSNTEEKPSTVVDSKTTILVQKLKDYTLSKTDENENIQYFAGTENPLELFRFYNQRFLCNYQLKWYPFDVQKCLLVMEIKGAYSPFVNLVVDDLVYTGEEILAQYSVIDTLMTKKDDEKIQKVQVEIILGRQLFGVLMNVFIPTIVLGLISYSTNFYKDEYFETVIAINLTTMLVIVTLFVSVSGQHPNLKISNAVNDNCAGRRKSASNFLHKDDRRVAPLQLDHSICPNHHPHIHGLHSEVDRIVH